MDPSSSSPPEMNPSPSPASLKLAGTCSGLMEVDLNSWTVPMLRQEIGNRSLLNPQSIKLISGGRVMKDGDQTLSELGVGNNAKILSTRVVVADPSMLAEEERSKRLTRIKKAADALTTRHTDGSVPMEDFNLEVEDQNGQKVQLGSETDQRGVMMGLMLYTNGKNLIKKHEYKEALDVLAMAEEAFSLCDPRVLAMIDNGLHLQIDMVWCYFMLRDITCLSMAGIRLEQARSAVQRSRRDSGTWPVLCLRLDLLEGVVAYHGNRFKDSLKALVSAQTHLTKLQVRDEDLSMLISMGFKEREAKMALRTSNQQADVAIDYLVQEREKKALRRQEDEQRRKDIRDQKRYGLTPLRKAVDLRRLNEFVASGFEKELAAEALRRHENDTEMAVIDLTNPSMSASMQMVINARTKKQKQDKLIDQLVLNCFERSKVVIAVRATNTQEEALSLLTVPAPDSSILTDNIGMPSAIPVHNNVDPALNAEILDFNTGVPPIVTADAGGSSMNNGTEVQGDLEMEDEIVQDLVEDPFADCDFDLTKEGEALTEYLALLKSVGHEINV